MTHFIKNYPEIIRNLPEIEINREGIKGWLLQDENHQLVFFEIQTTAKIPEHSHGAQWGIVIDGEMNLTLMDQKRFIKKEIHIIFLRGCSIQLFSLSKLLSLIFLMIDTDIK